MKPTWQTEDGSIQLFLDDCLRVLPQLEAGSVDAVVTDPPYGMAWESNQRFSGGNTRRGLGTRHEQIHGDDSPFDPSPLMAMRCPSVVWGANHFWNQLEPGAALVWKKRNDDALGTFLSDAEIAYMNRGCGVYLFSMTFCGSSRAVDGGVDAYAGSLHPNQKPVALMKWCLEKLKTPAGDTVCDPFMGSGTTGVACIRTGRKFIGIEKEAKYFEIAVNRIEAELNSTPLFDPKPQIIQREMFQARQT